MPDIRKRLGQELLVLDGALGTMLQRYEIPSEQCPEQLNILADDLIAGIHRDYVLAGADCVATNSFGGTRAKLDKYGLGDQVHELNLAAVRIARESGVKHILASVGPTGLLIEPLGSADFEYVFELYAEQIRALAAGAPDAILIETMTDIAEARCAVLAARSVCDLPVFATCTFALSGRMDVSGTDPATAAIILEAAGAEAVGINCGLGPALVLPLVSQMASATKLPIIAQPNSGIPQLVDGKTVFPGTPDEMGEYAARFVEAGAALVGSCCGSTPAFTGAIGDFARLVPLAPARSGLAGTAVAGPQGSVVLGEGRPLAVIGERINPTGKPDLAESLRQGSTSLVRQFAEEQAEAGADLLDVNVGAAGVDEVAMLKEATIALAGSCDLPLVLDTTDVSALEAALRVYPGKALVNSVNGTPESLAGVLPLVRKYGAAVVVLALDESGIPETERGRLEVVARIQAEATRAGIATADLVVDSLVMTSAIDPDAPRITVGTLHSLKEQGLTTVLGISNVSHGLPMRPALNAAFIGVAAAAGLDAVIANPADAVVAEAIKLADSARAKGVDATAHGAAWDAWDAVYREAVTFADEGVKSQPAADTQPASGRNAHEAALHPALPELLAAAIRRGDAPGSRDLVDALVAAGTGPEQVIPEILAPAIEGLGERFGRGEVFLPQLIVAAEAMKAAVAQVKAHLPAGDMEPQGTVVFATVKGDIHSIGKDICVSLLESQGFEVQDLGVDIEPTQVLDAVLASGPQVVCLSALMTTTLPAMAETVALLAEHRPSLPVMVGGAVVTAEWAASIGAGYSDDAPGCVSAVRVAIASLAGGGAGE